ncbi:MAG TPA: single-stranded DNA-binding protein [Geodermatophilus sp.]|nr:single-stranded DNA-binding protein [Geodermatophilus sp.]
MNDTFVTVIGNVVDSPRRNRTETGSPVTNFRMASTARRYDTRSQEFVDAGTFWVDVECWNDLSGNVSSSVSKGDPVIVHGALTTHSWEGENGRRSTPRIRAFAVGPNLARGTADFKRVRAARATEAGETTGRPPSSGSPETSDHEFPPAPDELLRGRDYEPDDEALHSMTADDLAAEPAHV